MAVPASFAIRRIRPDDTLNRLSLGTAESEPLKRFLRQKALKFEGAFLARTYVLVDSAAAEQKGRVWGYVTLVACDVQTTEQNCPEAEAGWHKAHNMPAIKLARLAVDASCREMTSVPCCSTLQSHSSCSTLPHMLGAGSS